MARVLSLMAIGLLPQWTLGLKPAHPRRTAHHVETLRERAASCPPEEDGRVTNIYYINVDSQYVRRQYMEKMLHNKSLVDECIGIHRLRAVEPEGVWDSWAAKKFAPEGCGWNSTDDGRKRCGNDITHRIGFDQCTRHKGLCLVLEDDALILEGWHDTLLKNMVNVPSNWTLIKLGEGGRGLRAEVDRVAGTHWFLSNRRGRPYQYNGSFAMILDRKRARDFLDYLLDKSARTADAWTALPGSYVYETNLVTRVPLTSVINNDGVSNWDTEDGSAPDLSDIQ